ncbi:MAG: hypothetical protein Q9227_000933 [Pyrenula ochraceoflavens]
MPGSAPGEPDLPHDNGDATRGRALGYTFEDCNASEASVPAKEGLQSLNKDATSSRSTSSRCSRNGEQDPEKRVSEEHSGQVSPISVANGSDLNRQATRSGGSATGMEDVNREPSGPPFSVFTGNQRRIIVFLASFGGFFSPLSSNIYFPALNSLAQDLNVSNGLINLTLTSYMIFQGLAPAFIGDLADTAGRRPAYLACFCIYLGANIGLALQNSYAALFVLRCVQSSGSSGTIALASGVVSDIAVASERGKYMGFITAGSLLGPSVGPVLGGILSEFLGWRAIFWFLVILGATFTILFFIFFPETSRIIVGNGSIAPKGYSMSLLNYLQVRRQRKEANHTLTPAASHSSLTPRRKRHFPNPLASIHILNDKETFILLLNNAFMFAGFYDIAATIPSLFAEIYDFNDLQIGLCYLPFGAGATLAALVNGQLLDRNFKRIAKKLDFPIDNKRQSDLRNFPIERARLQIALPMLYLACACILAHGWILDRNGPLAAVLVILFICGCSLTCAFNVTSTLIVDFYPQTSATATAANNLLRCLLGAGATAVITPMINGMGRGWAFTFISLMMVVLSPMLWAVYFKGMAWREQRRLRTEKAEEEREKRRATTIEEGTTRGGSRQEKDLRRTEEKR